MKKSCLIFFIFLLGGCFSDNNPSEDYAIIQHLNRRMEYLYDEGQPDALADFYHEDAVLNGPDDQLEGQAAIRKYWGSMSYPVSMKMETLIMHTSMDSMLNTAHWTVLENKITPAQKEKILSLSPIVYTVFQLAHMKTAYEREDITVFNKETTILLSWTENASGYFRIADSYLLN